jgi:hypothetical protein
MEESAGKCRPFPFVERDGQLVAGVGFRELPGDFRAFRDVVVSFRSHLSAEKWPCRAVARENDNGHRHAQVLRPPDDLGQTQDRRDQGQSRWYLAPRFLMDAIISPSKANLWPVEHKRSSGGGCCEGLRGK